jgi:hypothetical protein
VYVSSFFPASFFVGSASARAPTPRAIVGRLEEEMEKPREEHRPSRYTGPLDPQDETGLTSASREAHDRFSASNLFTNERLTRVLA